MSELDPNNSQFGNNQAGTLQLGAREQHQQEPNITFDEIQSTIREVLIIDDFPDNKQVEISVEYVVAPKAMTVKISKK